MQFSQINEQQLDEILWGEGTQQEYEDGLQVSKLHAKGKLTFDQMTPYQLALFMRYDDIRDFLSKEQMESLYKVKFPFLFD